DKERNVHRRLQGCAASVGVPPSGGLGAEPDRLKAGLPPVEESGQEQIVRQLEVWGGPADSEADSLEPCVLCARPRHGLTPRCAECRRDDAVLEELELTDDRGLRCRHCGRQFWSTPKTRDAILEATLRRDPACAGCEYEHSPDTEGCRASAVFLNFFRN